MMIVQPRGACLQRGLPSWTTTQESTGGACVGRFSMVGACKYHFAGDLDLCGGL